MGSRYVWNGFGIISFIRMLMRDHYLGVSIALYFIILATFGGIFYLWATRSPLYSVGWAESVADDTEIVQPYTKIEQMHNKSAAVTASPATGDQSGNITSRNMTITTTTGTSNPQVSINGESIALPENGSLHQVIQNNGSSARLDISVSAESGSDSTSSSSLDLSVESSSVAAKEAD